MLSASQLEQRSKAGKASYLAMVRRALEANPEDLDKAARHLTGSRRSHGFAYKRGVTTQYMLRQAVALRVPVADARFVTLCHHMVTIGDTKVG